MHIACYTQKHMGATPLQIRNMPDQALDTLRRRARQRRMSLTAYAREILLREASRRTMEDVLSAPRQLSGRPLSNREIRKLIAEGRR